MHDKLHVYIYISTGNIHDKSPFSEFSVTSPQKRPKKKNTSKIRRSSLVGMQRRDEALENVQKALEEQSEAPELGSLGVSINDP